MDDLEVRMDLTDDLLHMVGIINDSYESELFLSILDDDAYSLYCHLS